MTAPMITGVAQATTIAAESISRAHLLALCRSRAQPVPISRVSATHTAANASVRGSTVQKNSSVRTSW